MWVPSRISNLFLAVISAQGQHSLQWQPCHTIATGHQQLSAAPKPRYGRSPRPNRDKNKEQTASSYANSSTLSLELAAGKLQSGQDSLLKEYRTSYWPHIFDSGTSYLLCRKLISCTMHLHLTRQWWSPCCCPELQYPCLRGTSWCWDRHAAGRSIQAQRTRHREKRCRVFCRMAAESHPIHHPVACWWYQTLPHWRPSALLNKQNNLSICS